MTALTIPLRPTSLRNLSLLLHPFRRLSSTSINPTEISHFNALASAWWDSYGSSRLLHLMNPLRHDFILSCISSHPPASQKLRYLDIGCGGGIFAESAARLPNTATVTAIDPSAEVLEVAKRHKRRDPLLITPGRLEYKQMSVEELPVPRSVEEQYDILTLFEVMEHVSNPWQFLGDCLPFVKPGGWLVLSTIARTWTSWVTTKVVAEEVIRLVPRGTHEWTKYINEDEVRGFFGKEGEWGAEMAMGCIYVPGVGWRMVKGGERWGNYFFGVRRDPGGRKDG